MPKVSVLRGMRDAALIRNRVLKLFEGRSSAGANLDKVLVLNDCKECGGKDRVIQEEGVGVILVVLGSIVQVDINGGGRWRACPRQREDRESRLDIAYTELHMGLQRDARSRVRRRIRQKIRLTWCAPTYPDCHRDTLRLSSPGARRSQNIELKSRLGELLFCGHRRTET